MKVTVYDVGGDPHNQNYTYVAISETSVADLLARTPEEALNNYLTANWQHKNTGIYYDKYLNNPHVAAVAVYSTYTHPELFI